MPLDRYAESQLRRVLPLLSLGESRSRGSYTRGHSSPRSRASYSRGSPHRASDIRPSLHGHGYIWVVSEDALAVAARGVQESTEAPGRFAAAFRAPSCGNPGSVWWVPNGGFSPRADTTKRGRSRPEDCFKPYTPSPVMAQVDKRISINRRLTALAMHPTLVS